MPQQFLHNVTETKLNVFCSLIVSDLEKGTATLEKLQHLKLVKQPSFTCECCFERIF